MGYAFSLTPPPPIYMPKMGLYGKKRKKLYFFWIKILHPEQAHVVD